MIDKMHKKIKDECKGHYDEYDLRTTVTHDYGLYLNK